MPETRGFGLDITNNKDDTSTNDQQAKAQPPHSCAAGGPFSRAAASPADPASSRQTSASSVIAEEARRSLSCGICSGWLASSLILSCGHSFCGQCLFDYVNTTPACPACQVGLRAVPVRCLALDAAVGLFECQLAEPERTSLRQRIEDGKPAVNKLIKMLWWLAPPVMPALGSQDLGGGVSGAAQQLGGGTQRRRTTGNAPPPPPRGSRSSQSMSSALPPNPALSSTTGGGGSFSRQGSSAGSDFSCRLSSGNFDHSSSSGGLYNFAGSSSAWPLHQQQQDSTLASSSSLPCPERMPFAAPQHQRRFCAPEPQQEQEHTAFLQQQGHSSSSSSMASLGQQQQQQQQQTFAAVPHHMFGQLSMGALQVSQQDDGVGPGQWMDGMRLGGVSEPLSQQEQMQAQVNHLMHSVYLQ